MKLNILITGLSILLTLTATPAKAQIFPSVGGNCPSGSTRNSDGNCKQTADQKYQFIPQLTGNCPSNTTSVGAGQCRTQPNQNFIPATNGKFCPSGTTSASSGYCQRK